MTDADVAGTDAKDAREARYGGLSVASVAFGVSGLVRHRARTIGSAVLPRARGRQDVEVPDGGIGVQQGGAGPRRDPFALEVLAGEALDRVE